MARTRTISTRSSSRPKDTVTTSPTKKSYKRWPKPPYPYAGMAIMAIQQSPRGKLTLSEILTSISEMFTYFRVCSYQGWKDSVRHNLSQYSCFEILPDPYKPNGKCNKWIVNYDHVKPKFFARNSPSDKYKPTLQEELNVTSPICNIASPIRKSTISKSATPDRHSRTSEVGTSAPRSNYVAPEETIEVVEIEPAIHVVSPDRDIDVENDTKPQTDHCSTPLRKTPSISRSLWQVISPSFAIMENDSGIYESPLQDSSGLRNTQASSSSRRRNCSTRSSDSTEDDHAYAKEVLEKKNMEFLSVPSYTVTAKISVLPLVNFTESRSDLTKSNSSKEPHYNALDMLADVALGNTNWYDD